MGLSKNIYNYYCNSPLQNCASYCYIIFTKTTTLGAPEIILLACRQKSHQLKKTSRNKKNRMCT